MSNLINPNSISAKTLAVLMKPHDSITCFVEIDEESCNVTLRLEDDVAKIAGYPQTWRVWDESIPGDEENTYEDAENDPELESMFDEIVSIDAYVSRATEKEIFSQLKESLQKQFEDENFKDELTNSEKEEVFKKIDKAIAKL